MLFSVPVSHPALPGHFPGNPLVPGVVILDYVIMAAREAFPANRVNGIRKLKWLQPLQPGKNCEVQWAVIRDSHVRFTCLCDGERIAEGNLLLEMS